MATSAGGSPLYRAPLGPTQFPTYKGSLSDSGSLLVVTLGDFVHSSDADILWMPTEAHSVGELGVRILLKYILVNIVLGTNFLIKSDEMIHTIVAPCPSILLILLQVSPLYLWFACSFMATA